MAAMASSEENEVYESWEEMEDSGMLDKKLRTMQPRSTQDDSSPTGGGVVIIQDESLRSQYGPPEPAVKILKRPTRVNEGAQVNGDSRPRQHKTLQQREQEYAEARLRILGEAHSPEELPSSPTSHERLDRMQSKMEVLKTSDQDNLVQNSKNGDVSKVPKIPVGENIVRLPKGPDGSKGFVCRR